MKWELEDFSLPLSPSPSSTRRSRSSLDEKRSDREAYIQRVIAQLHAGARGMGIDAGDHRAAEAHLLDLAKDARQGRAVRDVSTTSARCACIVANVRECYTVLGVVHDLWTPIEGEFDDYIAQPEGERLPSRCTPR